MAKIKRAEVEQIVVTCDYFKCEKEATLDTLDLNLANELLKEKGFVTKKVMGEWKTFCCDKHYEDYLKSDGREKPVRI